MLGPMRLIFITPPDAALRHERAIAKQILQNHPHSTLHIRKPGWGKAEMKSYLEEVVECAGAGQLVLHHHHDLMEGHPSIRGLHFPAYARPPPPFLPCALGGTISTSFHNLEEAASDQWGALDYAFLSPVFDSISKVGYPSAGFNPAAVAWVTGRNSVPLIALGGITAERVGQVAAMGFRGVAVIGTVWGADDPLKAAQEMQHACDAVTLQQPGGAAVKSRQTRK